MESADPLKFKDTKPYPKRIKETQEKSQLKDAVRTAYGKMGGLDITIACMDFSSLVVLWVPLWAKKLRVQWTTAFNTRNHFL
jgi:hypothetical protein